MSTKETRGFQTEVKQLLNLMIHSLYSNREIFLRELISNASDAADKLRFLAMAHPEYDIDMQQLSIEIQMDQAAKTLSVKDNGVGMTRDETIDHLGTIAKSGTRQFLDNLSGDQAKDSKLIGQFGVGFYSVFMVADKVSVITRKAGLAADQAVRWESTGDGEYTIESATKTESGTEVILHLKSDAEEFLDDARIRDIIKKYSDHIALPILMAKSAENAEGEAEPVSGELEVVNQAKALWTRSKSEISDAEYQEFYKHIAHDFEDALTWIHNKVEGKQEYTSLLYLPKRAPFDLWTQERKSGLKLYVQRVFIMDNADLLPGYLRFVKGVIDTNDLPLNVSREILQHNPTLEKIKSGCVKKILDTLEKMAEAQPENYAIFWQTFGTVFKEGFAEDFANREQLTKLLRFASTHADQAIQTISLADYVSRMKSGQEHIYYVTAESFLAAKNSPHLEIFRQKGIEVLLLSDRIDEWMLAGVSEFEGKKLQSVSKGELDLDKVEAASSEDQAKPEDTDKLKQDFESVMKQMKTALGDKVKEVRLSARLTDSPACVVGDEFGMSLHLQRLMQAAGQQMPATAPILEINPHHPLVERLRQEQSDTAFSDWSHILLEQALLSENGHLEDPVSFVKRVNRYLS